MSTTSVSAPALVSTSCGVSDVGPVTRYTWWLSSIVSITVRPCRCATPASTLGLVGRRMKRFWAAAGRVISSMQAMKYTYLHLEIVMHLSMPQSAQPEVDGCQMGPGLTHVRQRFSRKI